MARSLYLAVAAMLVVGIALPNLAASSIGAPSQRVDLRVLLVTQTSDEPSLRAWESALRQEGVPFDTLQGADIARDRLYSSNDNRAYYQAVVLATSSVDATLSATAKDALETFRTTFGIRQVVAYAYPSSRYGLNAPTSSGSMSGAVGSLTPAGIRAFPYLKGPIPFDPYAYGYRTTPCVTCGGSFTTLLAGTDGSALLGVHTDEGGREQLVSTVDGNPAMLHSQLLRHGLLSWVTKGVYLGHNRNYVAFHIDDVLVPDNRWDVARNCNPDPPTAECPGTLDIRMTAADVTRAVSWMKQKDVKLDLLYNGEGGVARDALTKAFLDNRNRFNWINHTYSHPNLDSAALSVINTEIKRNVDWAKSNRVPLSKTELVTGEHSGLANPSMPQAISNSGIRWIAADASREPEQYAIGLALTVPRWPTNVFYNVATRDEQLDEYNYVYLPPSLGGNCVNTAQTTCRTQPIGWQEYTDLEASIMLRHVLANDPRPHYFHQSNLAEEGIFYDVAGALVNRYSTYVSAPLVRLSFSEAGTLLSQRKRWQEAASQVTAYVKNGEVFVSSTSAIDVPVTGTTAGASYAGETSGWISVNASTPARLALANRSDATNTASPTIEGTAQSTHRLTATTGTWSGVTPIDYRYQWQRCDTGSCANAAGATLATYDVTASDVGLSLRVVVTALNTGGSGSAVSAATSPVIPDGPTSLTQPTISSSGTPKVGEALTASPGTWKTMGDPTFAYQWQRFADVGGVWSWTNISGATAQTYISSADDAWKLVRVVVTATDSTGSKSASSEGVSIAP